MKDLVRREVRGLVPYDEEPATGLNLMANTNLFGANPALERALARVRPEQLADYPSLDSLALRQAVAQKLGVQPDMVVTGNGSNDLIDVVCRAVLEPGDRAAFHVPTFGMIPYFVRLNHGLAAAVPLGADWALDPDALLAADGKVTFVVRPNNPTGNAFPRHEVERVVREAEGIVVVDEAYVEFLGGESFVKEVREGHERLVVLRTFSKAHGMAGLRVGYAVTGPALARELAKVRGPFRLDAVAETAACLALADDRYLQETVAAVRSERANLRRLLEDNGFHVHRSDANFLFTRPPVDAGALARALEARGIHVRAFTGELSPYLRVTVGPPAVTARLRLHLKDALSDATGAGP